MPATTESHPLLRADDRARGPEHIFSHPLNPSSSIRMRRLGDAAGLTRIGVTLARVPPGKESFIYHLHPGEEEWVYILSGRGRAEIGEEVFEVGPGDFMGFPAPSVGHHLSNPFDEDLVYLMGGERHPIEVGEFPRLGARMVFDRDRLHLARDGKVETYTLPEFLARSLRPAP
jgi:uncharacterized cupin superfamily protein